MLTGSSDVSLKFVFFGSSQNWQVVCAAEETAGLSKLGLLVTILFEIHHGHAIFVPNPWGPRRKQRSQSDQMAN